MRGPAIDIRSSAPGSEDMMKRTTKLLTCTLLAASLTACAGMSERDRDTVVGAGVGTAFVSQSKLPEKAPASPVTSGVRQSAVSWAA